MWATHPDIVQMYQLNKQKLKTSKQNETENLQEDKTDVLKGNYLPSASFHRFFHICSPS